FLAVDLVVAIQYISRRHMRTKILACLYSMIFTYIIFEIAYSCYSSVISARRFFVFEEPVSLEYDPVMGYKYASRPARWSLVISDEIQFSSTIKGNNYGFADKDDFSPRRTNDGRRILVLGDSFTGMPVCDELWPDYVERLAARDGRTLTLLDIAMG